MCDELPQLLNILKADMAIVGPRPLMPEEIEMYGESFYDYITVKSDLTGLWQIKSRSITSMQARAELDEEYLSKMGLQYNLIIMFKTVGTVLSRKGAC